MRVRSEKPRRRDSSRAHDRISVESTTMIKLPNADFAKKLSRRLHLDPLLWLLEKGIFSTPSTKNLEQVAAVSRAQSTRSTCCKARLNIVVESDSQTQVRSQEANEVIESDDEAQDAYEEVKWMIRLKLRQMRRLNWCSTELRNGAHLWRGDDAISR